MYMKPLEALIRGYIRDCWAPWTHNFIWLQVQLRMGSVPICHFDPQSVSACRSGHELELTTSRVNRGHKGSGWQDYSDSENYLNPDQTNDFRSVLVLSDYFNHNPIWPLKSHLHKKTGSLGFVGNLRACFGFNTLHGTHK